MLDQIESLAGSRLDLRNDSFEDLLREASETLDLTTPQREQAESSYDAIGTWLDAPDSPLRIFRPCVFPQGSFPLGTITKPLGRDDFDLDATCVLNVPATVTPALLKQLIGDRLKAHKLYRDMLEEKSRCWRLNYSRDFHLDITPGKPVFPLTEQTAIWITDKPLLRWLPSDPKGYIAWFKVRKLVSRGLFENRSAQANVEPIPPADKPHEKAPLQIVVQLLKRHRDVTFVGRDDAPISIIITTLAGLAYRQEPTALGTLRALLDRMPKCIDYSRGYAFIANPTNPAENFADRWKEQPRLEAAFCEWIEQVGADLDRLEVAAGLKEVRAALVPFLGEKRADIVLNRRAEKINMERDSGLKADRRTGLLTVSTSGIVVPKNNFFGDAPI